MPSLCELFASKEFCWNKVLGLPDAHKAFSAIDYAVFGAVLLVSFLIGAGYAVRLRKAKSQYEEFLLGGRTLPIIPTALSLLTSFISGIAILSYPAEIYTMGTAFVWTTLGAALSITISAFVVIPVFYHIKSVNLYQYLEDRFQSKILRCFGSVNFTLSTIIYMAVVLYTPSVALSAATGLRTWVFIVAAGTVCTLYTTIGGIKAVIWTDTFQAFIMVSGVVALLAKACSDVGGPGIVWERNKQMHRLDGLLNTDPDPFQYMTVWTASIGGTFYFMGAFCASQIALQRYCSLSSMRRAQLVALINIPSIAVIFLLVFATGLVMFAYYVGCDPMKKGTVGDKDQLTIHFMLDVFAKLTGLPGLFMACIFSGTLSTVSSGLNSMTAVCWEDWVRPICRRTSERRKSLLLKMITLLYGVLTIALANCAKSLGGVLQMLLGGLGCFIGPNAGLIFLGLLVPWANFIGALVGVILATVFDVWIFVGRLLMKPDAAYSLPTSTFCCNASASLLGQCSYGSELDFRIYGPSPGRDGIARFYSLSNLMMPVFGWIIVVIAGAIISLFTGGSSVRKTHPQLVFWSMTPCYKNKSVSPESKQSPKSRTRRIIAETAL